MLLRNLRIVAQPPSVGRSAAARQEPGTGRIYCVTGVAAMFAIHGSSFASLPCQRAARPQNKRREDRVAQGSTEEEIMAKRMIVMLTVTLVVIAALAFVKFRQVKAAIAVYASFQPPPEAVTTTVAHQERWPATLNAIGTVAAVRGVTVSADLPGIVEKIAFDSGDFVREGDVLVQLDTRQEQAQLAAADAQRD